MFRSPGRTGKGSTHWHTPSVPGKALSAIRRSKPCPSWVAFRTGTCCARDSSKPPPEGTRRARTFSSMSRGKTTWRTCCRSATRAPCVADTWTLPEESPPTTPPIRASPPRRQRAHLETRGGRQHADQYLHCGADGGVQEAGAAHREERGGAGDLPVVGSQQTQENEDKAADED